MVTHHGSASTARGAALARHRAATRRCVIPVDAWYERGTRPGVRRDYHAIAARDRSSVALAALWWPGPTPDAPRRLVIVTKAAQGAPARIHHRCPMVVAQHEVRDWVDPTFPEIGVRQMLARASADEGAFEPVALAA